MYLFKTADGLKSHIRHIKSSNQKIGFVPTMGALHEGHLSLIRQSLAVCSHTICSIFVNPTQFNEASDLQKYPRTPAKDIALLHSVGTDMLFMPSESEIYPDQLDTALDIDFGPLESVMEGAFRPGHFAGVAQVVNRLLELTDPDMLFMGQKDFQQALVVQKMIEKLQLEVELVVVPIVRNEDGLALSSRNVRLSEKGRRQALALSQALKLAKALAPEKGTTFAKEEAIALLEKAEGVKLEYFEIADGNQLQPLTDEHSTDFIVACVAAWVEDVRLIDNMILKGGF